MSIQDFSFAYRGNDGSVTTSLPVSSKTTTYTIDVNDDIGREIAFDTSSADLTANLPTAASAGNGFNVILRNTAAGLLTIEPSGAETIDGKASKEIGLSEVLWVRSDGVSWRSLSGLTQNTPGTASPNLLINGGFSVAQRGTFFDSATTPANNNDTYLLDRWLLLSDGNDVVDVMQETAIIPSGSYAGIKLEVETANKKAGILQVLETRDSSSAIGNRVSLSFVARAGDSNVTVDKLRAAVVSWSSTADEVTSDIVSNWSIEGNDPTLVANWSYENTSSDMLLSNSYQTYRIDDIGVDTLNSKNVGVFIWIDNDDGTLDDTVYISQVKLEDSPVATIFVAEKFSNELAQCQRYYFRQFGASYTTFCAGICFLTASATCSWPLPVQMRKAPTLNGVGNFRVISGSATVAVTAITSGQITDTVILINATVTGGLTVGDGALFQSDNSTTAYLEVDAEL